jgi:flagellar biogenesis protein FliO
MGLAGVGLWLRGRKAGAPGSSDIRLRVLRRLSVGARNEVLLIEFDGQRILIGSTPNSIQTLVHCNLDAELSEASDATQAPTEAEPVAASERIETANAPPRRPRSTHVARLAPAPQEDLGIEEQARGLRALLGGR